jgi:hypothetical protein
MKKQKSKDINHLIYINWDEILVVHLSSHDLSVKYRLSRILES